MVATELEVVFWLLVWVVFETVGGLAKFLFLLFMPARGIVPIAFECDSVEADSALTLCLNAALC